VQVAQAGSPLREKFLEGTPYEVKIKAPQRPEDAAAAAENEAKAAEDAKAAADNASEQAKAAAVSPGPIGPKGPSGPKDPASMREAMETIRPTSAGISNGPNAGDVLPKPGAGGIAADPTATASIAPPARGFSLQVGAFRELRSAIALKGRLAKNFSDVYVSTVESGGEPLYRIRVGSFKAPEETLPMKMQLQAAGYPSFRVSEDK
jgi:cell division septation protein DedD